MENVNIKPNRDMKTVENLKQEIKELLLPLKQKMFAAADCGANYVMEAEDAEALNKVEKLLATQPQAGESVEEIALKEYPIQYDEDEHDYNEEYRDVFIKGLLKSRPAQSEREWISVDERLPEYEGNIIVLAFYPRNNMAFLSKFDGKFHTPEHAFGIPTHWVPLPSPPITSTQNDKQK